MMATVDRDVAVPFLVPTYYTLSGEWARLSNYEQKRDLERMKRFDLHFYRDSSVNEIITRFLEHLKDEEKTSEPGTIFRIATIYANYRRASYERKNIARIEVGNDRLNRMELKRRPFGKPFRAGEMVEITVKYPRGVIKRSHDDKSKDETAEKKAKTDEKPESNAGDAKSESGERRESKESNEKEESVIGESAIMQDSAVDADLLGDVLGGSSDMLAPEEDSGAKKVEESASPGAEEPAPAE